MPLAGPVLERLAASAAIQHAAAGTAIITEGEAGDTFYAIAAGAVEVTVPDAADGAVSQPPRRLGAGRLIRRDRPDPRRATDCDRPRARADRAGGP